MEYIWRLAKTAIRDLDHLDERFVRLFFKKVDAYCTSPDPLAFAKALNEPWKGLYRFRIGDYRAIFRKESSGKIVILLILRVKHRSEAYE